MNGIKLLSGLLLILAVNSVQAKKVPTQVVYRFDDHRYLELKGWNCEGELWYIDTQIGYSFKSSRSVLSRFHPKICTSL